MEQELFDRVYQAVVHRASTYEGIYYTGVKSTKIVCRPTCRAKTPLARNVTFFRSIEDALAAGFRPCKRCKPDENGVLRPDALLVKQVNEVIDSQFHTKLTLRILAARLAVSPYHLQRIYKQIAGLSPKEQIRRVRIEHALVALHSLDIPIADIAIRTGCHTPSHFATWFRRYVGLSPEAYREQYRRGVAHV
jgi:AraC family transcriptional regulator, regulatory protein of adaptative response / methylphosphotriester-DNA alkyltransferase methyltransferase